MRKLKSLLIVAFLALGMSGVANAQKVGHVNLERVIANMPETRALQTEIEKISKTYKDDITGMAKKFEAKYKKYSAEQASQTDDVNKQRAEEIQGERNRIQQAEQAAGQDIQQRQQTKLIPILQKAEKAIKEVAKAKGLLYILDGSAGKGLLVADGTDIYEDLKVKLGLLPNQKQPQPAAQK
ncbi:MAG: OmpH family outer membrane protein [Flavobacteriaceae bacterium]